MILVGLRADVQSRHGLPEEVVLRAKGALAENEITIKKSSPIYLGSHKNNNAQDYLPASQVVSIDTHLYPLPLLALLQDIENDFGRHMGLKNGQKSLEIFLLSYKFEVFKNDYMTLPYPDLHEQTHFLLSINEIYPNWIHPFFDRSIERLLSDRDDTNEYILEQDLKNLQISAS